jgi:hypothetical protein
MRAISLMVLDQPAARLGVLPDAKRRSRTWIQVLKLAGSGPACQQTTPVEQSMFRSIRSRVASGPLARLQLFS